MLGRDLRRPLRGRDVDADLDHRRDAHRGRRRDGASPTSLSCRSRWVWLSGTGTRSGSGAGGIASRDAASFDVLRNGRTLCHSPGLQPRRASSSSTIDGSSLVKIGVGVASFVPATIGWEAQTASVA